MYYAKTNNLMPGEPEPKSASSRSTLFIYSP
jgi:hypothetical protein